MVLHLAVLMRQEITMNCSRRFCSYCVDHFGYVQCVAVGDPSGVSAERLGKLWRISEEDAQIEQMTQLGRLSSNTTLKESSFPTNDRALCNKRFIDNTSYADATLRPQVLTCTIVQVHVSEKGFIYVRLMK